MQRYALSEFLSRTAQKDSNQGLFEMEGDRVLK